jgi:hypothetical protein
VFRIRYAPVQNSRSPDPAILDGPFVRFGDDLGWAGFLGSVMAIAEGHETTSSGCIRMFPVSHNPDVLPPRSQMDALCVLGLLFRRRWG